MAYEWAENVIKLQRVLALKLTEDEAKEAYVKLGGKLKDVPLIEKAEKEEKKVVKKVTKKKNAK